MQDKPTKVFSNYLSLVKFSHTLFALPFALIGFFLAIRIEKYEFDWLLLIKVIGCMVFARNAAMAFNRYIDRELDLKNPRTAIREIPKGIIKAKTALHFVIINALLFMITCYFINTITLYLSPIALLVILGYSFTKKITVLCHFILGIGLSLAPIGAYLAVTGKFAILPLLFSFIVFFWVSGFDIIYALQDIDFDKSENLRSIPAWMGNKNALILSFIVHILSAILVIFIGFFQHFGIFYLVGSILFISLLVYQHIIIKPHDISKLNIAFFTLNGIASIIFAIFTLLELFYLTL